MAMGSIIWVLPAMGNSGWIWVHLRWTFHTDPASYTPFPPPAWNRDPKQAMGASGKGLYTTQMRKKPELNEILWCKRCLFLLYPVGLMTWGQKGIITWGSSRVYWHQLLCFHSRHKGIHTGSINYAYIVAIQRDIDPRSVWHKIFRSMWSWMLRGCPRRAIGISESIETRRRCIFLSNPVSCKRTERG